MQSRRLSDISVISAIVALILGFSASPAQATSFKCVDNTTVEVCAEWSLVGDEPVEGTDFRVTFNDGDGADVELLVGDLEWRLWTTLVSGGAVTSFGAITLDPTVDADNFAVRIWGDGEAGAIDVGSLNLDGKISNPDWEGYSSIRDVSALSWITGDVNGVITLVEDTGIPPEGGELGYLTIKGDVAGKITIPTLTGSLAIGTPGETGDVLGGFEIGGLNGSLTIHGTLPSNKIGEIGDIDSGSFDIHTVAADATLHLLNGMPLAAAQSNVTTLAGTIDLHTKDVRTNLFLQNAPSTGKVINGGTVTANFYPSAAGGNFAGEATFTNVAAGGKIWSFQTGPPDTDISGKITITNDYAGLFKVDGDFTSTASLTINGDLKASSGDDGLIWIVEEAAGDVLIKGDLIGHVHHPKSFPTNGSLTVEGNVTGSGLFKTGDNATGETHDGDLTFEGNVAGDVLIHGNMSGGIQIDGDLSADVTIDGDLSGTPGVVVDGVLANSGLTGGGRIMVGGESSAPIKVGKRTESLTLIQVAEGLATGGTVEINTSEGPYSASGDIHIGGTTPAELPFDGCIRIHDQIFTSANGDLIGDIDIVMCHEDAEDLNICIDGSDGGNVTLDQTGCTNTNATWSCSGCP